MNKNLLNSQSVYFIYYLIIVHNEYYEKESYALKTLKIYKINKDAKKIIYVLYIKLMFKNV